MRWLVSLSLYSRLLRFGGDAESSAECVERIRNAGFVKERLEGLLLTSSQRGIERAILDGSKTWEREGRHSASIELCIIIELGGSPKLPVSKAEQMFQENSLKLKILVGAPTQITQNL